MNWRLLLPTEWFYWQRSQDDDLKAIRHWLDRLHELVNKTVDDLTQHKADANVELHKAIAAAEKLNAAVAELVSAFEALRECVGALRDEQAKLREWATEVTKFLNGQSGCRFQQPGA